MAGNLLPPLKPLPMKDRVSMIFVQYGQIDVQDGAFVVIDKTGVRMHIPVGSVACIMLEPGTRVSHAAVHLASTVGSGRATSRLQAWTCPSPLAAPSIRAAVRTRPSSVSRPRR